MQDRVQQRLMDFHLAVVTDETQFPEFVHEGADAGSRGADHFRQRPLIETGIDRLRAAFLAEIGEQEQKAREPLLAGIEQLIDQILLDPAVAP